MKKTINLTSTVLFVIIANYFSYFATWVFSELSPLVDDIFYYGQIPFFLLICFFISIFSYSKNVSVNKLCMILFVLLLSVRIFEVLIYDSRTGIAWNSFSIPNILVLEISKSSDTGYWWTIPVYPLLQPFCVMMIHKLLAKINIDKSIAKKITNIFIILFAVFLIAIVACVILIFK